MWLDWKLKGIREDNHKGRKANSLIHNFWSFSYIIQRFKGKAEECGIEVVEVDEQGTSSKCPRCRSHRISKHGRLSKCLSCGGEAHRDAVGVLNIGARSGSRTPCGSHQRGDGTPLASKVERNEVEA